MTMNVISFFRPKQTRDWSNEELAQLYRVDGALLQLGIGIETDRGLTDEGDPWFVFCRAEGGDVLVHVARFDGDYHLIAPTVSISLRGRSFAQLTQDFVEAFPVSAPLRRAPNVFLHPASLLTMLVAAVFISSDESHAATIARTGAPDGSAAAASPASAGWFGKSAMQHTDAAPRADSQNYHLSMYLNAVGAAIALVLGVAGDHALDFSPSPLQLDNSPVVEMSALPTGFEPVSVHGAAMDYAADFAGHHAAPGLDAPAPQKLAFVMAQAELPAPRGAAPVSDGDVAAPAVAASSASAVVRDAVHQDGTFFQGNELIRSFGAGQPGSSTPESAQKVQPAEARSTDTAQASQPASAGGDKVVVASQAAEPAKFQTGQGNVDYGHLLYGKVGADGLLVFDNVVKVSSGVSQAALQAPAAPKLFDTDASRVLKSFLDEHPKWVASVQGSDYTVSDGLAGPAVTLHSWDYNWGGTIKIVGHLPLMDLVA